MTIPNSITFGIWTVPTFTFMLAFGITVSTLIGLRRSQHPGRTADLYLGALVGGLIGARSFHVLLNWDYFATSLNEAPQLSLGGLDWHGAVFGALLGLWIMTKLSAISFKPLAFSLYQSLTHRQPSQSQNPTSASPTHTSYLIPQHSPLNTQYSVLSTLSFALPLIGLAGWYGCAAAACGYGREVDTLANYPALIAVENPDVFGIIVPRFNTQFFGIILCITVLLITLVLSWRGWLPKTRFWFILALLSAGMFVIGFLRGDHTLTIAGLRLDQLLDLIFIFQFPVVAYIRYRHAKSQLTN